MQASDEHSLNLVLIVFYSRDTQGFTSALPVISMISYVQEKPHTIIYTDARDTQGFTSALLVASMSMVI